MGNCQSTLREVHNTVHNCGINPEHISTDRKINGAILNIVNTFVISLTSVDLERHNSA